MNNHQSLLMHTEVASTSPPPPPRAGRRRAVRLNANADLPSVSSTASSTVPSAAAPAPVLVPLNVNHNLVPFNVLPDVETDIKDRLTRPRGLRTVGRRLTLPNATDQDGKPIKPDHPDAFIWTTDRERAAVLLAQGLTIQRAATELQISGPTLNHWNIFPQFQKRVSEYREVIRQSVLTQGIADKVRRIGALNDRWERLLHVVNARAAHYPTLPDGLATPGADSGVLVREEKVIGSGINAREIVDYKLDAPLMRELREVELQAAKELGQLTEKSEVTLIPKAYVGVDLDKV